MTNAAVWVVIVLIGLGSFVSRAFFFFLASRVAEVPESAKTWLRMVPPAAFAALVAPAIFVPGETFRVLSAHVLAAGLAAATAWRTKSIAACILVGLGGFMLLEQVPVLS